MSARLVLVVACALFSPSGRVLLAQRPEGKAMAGLWEFPGGKVDAGETPEQALAREMFEELGIRIKVSDLEPVTFASHSYPDFHLLMPLYACQDWTGEVVAREGQALAWVAPTDLRTYPAPMADLPLFDVLAARSGEG